MISFFRASFWLSDTVITFFISLYSISIDESIPKKIELVSWDRCKYPYHEDDTMNFWVPVAFFFEISSLRRLSGYPSSWSGKCTILTLSNFFGVLWKTFLMNLLFCSPIFSMDDDQFHSSLFKHRRLSGRRLVEISAKSTSYQQITCSCIMGWS